MNLFPKIQEAAACYGQSFRCVNFTHYQKCAPFDSRYPRRTTASSAKLRCPEEKFCDDRSDDPCEFFSMHAHKFKWPHRIILKRPNQMRKLWQRGEEEEVEEDKGEPDPDNVEETGPDSHVDSIDEIDEGDDDNSENHELPEEGPDDYSENHELPEGGPDGEEAPEEDKEEAVVDLLLPEQPHVEVAPGVVAPIQTTKAPTSTPVLPSFEDNCNRVGRHSYPNNCQKYIMCTRSNIYIYRCPRDFAFNRYINNCVRNWQSCPYIRACTFNGQRLSAPGDPNGFLLCVARLSGLLGDEESEKYTNFVKRPNDWLQSIVSSSDLGKLSLYQVFKRHCPVGEIFNPSSGNCN